MKHSTKPMTIVIKLGTSSIVDETTHQPLLSILTHIVETAVQLRRDGHRVVIVSSGAIGVGLRRMDVSRKPKQLSQLQALAAIGQCRLMGLWDELFGHLRQPIAQILLTRIDIQDHNRFRNAQNTLHELMDMGVIPIVNENDTLAVAEIKFGDNDTLSAITSAMIHAEYLFLMTDVDCLYDKNPRTNLDAQAIEVIEDISALQADVSTSGSSLGTGGMGTKIVAAKLATSAGVTTIITRASNPGNIVKIVRYCQSLKSPSSSRPASVVGEPSEEEDAMSHSTSSLTPSIPSVSCASQTNGANGPVAKPPLHTRFLPAQRPIRERRFWLLHGPAPHGTIYIDQGAYKALLNKANLLPVGIVDVEGQFHQSEAVRLSVVTKRRCPNAEGKMWDGPAVEVGRLQTNYASMEIQRIMGHQSADIKELLGYADSEQVAHRNQVCFLSETMSQPSTPWMSRAPTPSPEHDFIRSSLREAQAV